MYYDSKLHRFFGLRKLCTIKNVKLLVLFVYLSYFH